MSSRTSRYPSSCSNTWELTAEIFSIVSSSRKQARKCINWMIWQYFFETLSWTTSYLQSSHSILKLSRSFLSLSSYLSLNIWHHWALETLNMALQWHCLKTHGLEKKRWMSRLLQQKLSLMVTGYWLYITIRTVPGRDFDPQKIQKDYIWYLLEKLGFVV